MSFEFLWYIPNQVTAGHRGEPVAAGHNSLDTLTSQARAVEDHGWKGALIGAEEILYGLAARIDAGDEDAARRAGVAKLLVTRSIIAAVQSAVTALGNPALTRGNPLERHYRDLHCSRIHPPQDDAALIAAGRRVLAR